MQRSAAFAAGFILALTGCAGGPPRRPAGAAADDLFGIPLGTKLSAFPAAHPDFELLQTTDGNAAYERKLDRPRVRVFFDSERRAAVVMTRDIVPIKGNEQREKLVEQYTRRYGPPWKEDSGAQGPLFLGKPSYSTWIWNAGGEKICMQLVYKPAGKENSTAKLFMWSVAEAAYPEFEKDFLDSAYDVELIGGGAAPAPQR